MSEANLQIRLARRPAGWVQESDFEIAESPIPAFADGQVLVRNQWLSLDPYMRGRMDAAKSYAKSLEIGEVMVGGTVGVVVESRHPDFKAGELVNGPLGWQRYAATDGGDLFKIPDEGVPPQAYLGVVGMPGVTAYVGLLDHCAPREGETVVVSAASGAVGSVVGQLAKILGCRAVGIAGGPEKCRYVVEELGFDACVDHKAGNLLDDLRAAAPKGVDVNFENVGGEVFDTVLRLMNPFSRIAVCGLISQYNATEPYGYRNLRSVLVNRIKVQGFIVSDDLTRWPPARKDLARWVREGRIKYRETIAEGLASAPRAFIGLLEGRNFGKQLVRVGE